MMIDSNHGYLSNISFTIIVKMMMYFQNHFYFVYCLPIKTYEDGTEIVMLPQLDTNKSISVEFNVGRRKWLTLLDS